MAESLTSALKEELTCTICTELLHNPVALPCQHNFCRDCLETYVNSSDKSDKARSVDCPTCRSTFQLGDNGVGSLPRHFVLANIVEKYHAEVNKERVLCSVCQWHPACKAVKTCLSCKLSYCSECISPRHPLVGAFASHILVDPTTITAGATCEDHEEPLKLFCVDCQRPICFLCDRVGIHREHVVSDLKTAFQDSKKSVQIKFEKLRSTLSEATYRMKGLSKEAEQEKSSIQSRSQKCEEGFTKIHTQIREKQDSTLMAFKDESLKLQKETDNKLIPLSRGVAQARKCLEVTGESMKETDVIGFLMSSQLIAQRIDKEMSSVNSLLMNLGNNKTRHGKLTPVLDGQPELYLVQLDRQKGEVAMHPTCLYRGRLVQCPELLFDRETAHESVMINPECKEFVSRKGVGVRNLRGALVSASFREGVLYYETEVSFTIRKKLDRNRFLFSAGVVQHGHCDPRFLGQDSYSWGFVVEKRDQLTIVAMHMDNARSCYTPPAYQASSKFTVRFGFLLDCDNSEFFIFDISHGYLIHTFTLRRQGVSLKPAFAAYNHGQVEVAVSLKTRGDIATIPLPGPRNATCSTSP